MSLLALRVTSLACGGVVSQQWAVFYTPRSICAGKGSTVTLGCTYTYPTYSRYRTRYKVEKAFWTRELGQRHKEPPDLSSDPEYRDRVQYLGDTLSDCRLRLSDVREQDQGRYYFRFITNIDGGIFQGRPGVFLSVRELQVEMIPDEVVEGKTVTLTCKNTCSPTVSWYKSGNLFSSSSNPLRLRSVSQRDSGDYSCAAQGEDYRSPAVTLDVQYPPKRVSVSISPSGEMVEGSSVTLTCSSDANPPVETYSWYKGGSYRGRGETYTIDRISSEDSGEYKCSATNKHGTQSSPAVSLNVLYPPKSVSVSISPSGEMVEGSSVTLTCSSDANSPVETYSWYKGRSYRGRGETYTIDRISSEDSGEYKCSATNKHGTWYSPAVSLNVLYPPKNVSVSISPSGEMVEGSSVTLTCSSDANPPVETYSWYKVNESSPVGSGQSYSFTLSFSSSGWFYCVAQNKYGNQRAAAVPLTVNGSRSVVLYVVLGVTVGFGCLCAIIGVLFMWRKRRRGSADDATSSQNVHSSLTDDTYRALNPQTRSYNDTYDTLATVHPSPPDDTPAARDSQSVSPDYNNLPIFMRPDFILSEPATFSAVLPWSHFSVAGGKSGRDAASSRLLQEKLSHYLDVVEVSIAIQISLRSEAFFHAMSSQRELQEQLCEAAGAVRALREHTAGLGRTMSRGPLQALRHTVTRRNCVTLHSKLKLMAAVQQTQPTVQLLLSTSEFVGALELINTTKEVLQQELQASELQVEMSPDEVVEGETVTLTCKITCSPTVSWYRSGNLLSSSSNPLRLQSVSQRDSGDYSCAAQGEDYRSPAVTLDVQYPPKRVSVSISPSGEMVEGSSVTLTCSSDANPPVETYRYIWYKGILDRRRGETYTIDRISSEDSGEYDCSATNKHGARFSPAVSLNVLYPPKNVSVSISPSGEMVEGSSVTLTCSGDANPPVETYSWYKVNESSPVGSGQSYNFTLSFSSSGWFYCVAQNKYGNQRAAAVPLTANGSRSVVLYVVLGVTVGFGCLCAIIGVLFMWRKRRRGSADDATSSQKVHSSPTEDMYTALDPQTRSYNDTYDTLVTYCKCVVRVIVGPGLRIESCVRVLSPQNVHSNLIDDTYTALDPQTRSSNDTYDTLAAEGKSMADVQALLTQQSVSPTEAILRAVGDLFDKSAKPSAEGGGYCCLRIFSGTVPTPAGEE
ncbi:titin-like [Neoarius graeffei]|uniref:titin-like n=1 Tax=Neoarius graeffei TaxID=443677 RepID=UPI00298C69CE|nr:titin-like [Neoarius graeffei]